MITVPTFNQGDSRWRDKPLGTSGMSMWNAGCFDSTTAVMLNNYGYAVNPGQLCDALNAAQPIMGFDPDGLERWNVVEALFPNVVMTDSFNTTLQPGNDQHVQMDTALKRIARAVRIGMVVGVCVWIKNGLNTGKPNHIVALVDAPDSGPWTYHDSNGGKVGQFTPGSQFGTPDQAIYGARILVGSPTSFPDYSTDADKEDGQACFKASQVMRGRNVQTYSKEIVDSLLGK